MSLSWLHHTMGACRRAYQSVCLMTNRATKQRCNNVFAILLHCTATRWDATSDGTSQCTSAFAALARFCLTAAEFDIETPVSHARPSTQHPWTCCNVQQRTQHSLALMPGHSQSLGQPAPHSHLAVAPETIICIKVSISSQRRKNALLAALLQLSSTLR